MKFDKQKIVSSGIRKFIKAKDLSVSLFSSLAASLSTKNDLPFNWEDIDRIVNATKSHSISGIEYINKLPGELERFGTAAVETYIKGGDKLGKHWSHIKSQKNSPELADDASNAILEDGTVNVSRGATNMTIGERVEASIDNHLDGFKTLYTSPEFWERTLGNAFETGVYAMALAAVDQLLIRREELINGNNIKRKEIIQEILQKSGLIGAGSLPVSIFLGICLTLVPGLATVLGPIGLLAGAKIGWRLSLSAMQNPTRQEKFAISKVQDFLKDKIYKLKRNQNGNFYYET